MHRAVHLVIMAIVIMAVKQCFICAPHKEPCVKKKKKSPERLTKPLISVLSDIIDDLLLLLVSSVSHV